MNLNDLKSFFIKLNNLKLIKNKDNFITKKNNDNIKFNTNKIKYILEIFKKLNINWEKNNYKIDYNYNIKKNIEGENINNIEIIKNDKIIMNFKDVLFDEYYLRYYKNYIFKCNNNGKILSYEINYNFKLKKILK
jgi:hypothetical protein